MFRLAALLGLLGLAAATAAIVWSGWPQVEQALGEAGWGIAAIAAFHMISLLVSSAGWYALVPGARKPSLPMFVYFMWVRASVNNLMPVARIGGEVAAVRLMIAKGMDKNTAIAATVVELTLSIMAIFLFVLIGSVAFALHINNTDITRQLLWGIVLALPLLMGLIAVQRVGFFGLLLRLFRAAFRKKWLSLADDAAHLDHAVISLYKDRTRPVICFILQFTAWSLGSVEIWMGLRFLGHALPMAQALMIEALIQASASAAFAIPGALGVQEAGFLLFGAMLGLPPSIAGALAVMRRCRDLLCYAPALIFWQVHEGKKLLRN